jgi:aspartate carbamoyltransferase catalytic subunit
MLKNLRIPIVNAGNGTDEHPTQALTDVYTIFKWRPALLTGRVPEKDRPRIGIIGVPKTMRTVRSLLYLLSLFPNSFSEVVIISHEKEIFDTTQAEYLTTTGLNVRVTEDMDKELPELDIVYINSIAWIGDSYEQFGKDYKLSKDSPLKPDAIVLHPLARGKELATDLDDTNHNWYFAQARSAVFIRMALLTCLVQHNW